MKLLWQDLLSSIAPQPSQIEIPQSFRHITRGNTGPVLGNTNFVDVQPTILFRIVLHSAVLLA